jgi:DNA-binding winged helix-turn-helix (wHTH) protein/tetratricopeptide (TPR) repeat protein
LPHKHFYEFGGFRIDPALARLERDGEPIALSPKAFDLLVLLARNTHRLMPKTELMETLWPNTFVEEANLTQYVYTLRKALGDQADGQPYIETQPRRGYRLAANVRDVSVESNAPDASSAAGTPPAAVPAAVVASDGERKQATVLLCRVANVAALVERLGAAGANDLIGTVIDNAATEIAKYDGVITERRPDGFTAVFGVPVVHEDAGRRATLAAIDIREQLRRLSPSDDEPLDVQIGIGSGSLVVSGTARDGRVHYAAVGDAAKQADQLAQLCEPGSILINDTTRRVVEGFVETAATDLRAGTSAVARVLRPIAGGVAPSKRFARTPTPFVGRNHELGLLDNLAALARAGKGHVVSIVGEPGMGKSRLLHEFTQRADTHGMTLLEARCVSYGSLIPYLPLAALIRAQCGVVDGDAPDTLQRAVARVVSENQLPPDAGAWLLRLLGIVDGGGALDALSPEAIKARTFDALRTLFLKASVRTPLVIVVEDIHWIDRTSEEFLGTLIERLVAARAIIVATYRPGYRPPWVDRSYLTQITLTPLTAADGAHLITSVAHGHQLPADIAAAIVEKADGNPFFLEELARTVVERGTDAAQTIPDTVHGVIMARVDRLPDIAKQILQTASVLGREVPLPLLTRMWQGGAMQDEIGRLCRLEFMYERSDGDETMLLFKHALTQDVAYDSLLARSRRDLHLRAAQALEAMHGDRRDDLAATFAYHYARTDRVTEALHWLTRAADQAARVYANIEAMLHLDLAARRVERLPEGLDRDRRMIEVAMRRAHSLYFLGRFRDSVDGLLPLEGRVARLNDTALAAQYSFWLAHMYSRLGDQPRAAELAHRAIDAGSHAGDIATVGKAHGLLALEGHWSGNAADGIPHGLEAVRILSLLPEQRWWLGMAHFYLATNYLLTGEFDDGLAETARAAAVGRAIGDPRLQTYAGYTTGWIEASRGNSAVAIAACRASLESAPDRVSRAYARLFLAFALLEGSDAEPALAQLQEAVVELEGFNFPQWHGLALVLIGDAHRRCGRLTDAATAVSNGIAVATRARYWYGVGIGERVGARIAAADGRPHDAAAGFTRAEATFNRISARFELERTRMEAASSSE